MWYSNGKFWCTVIALVFAVGNLFLLPSWWRGSWHASRVRWRDRAWLVTVLAVIALCVATILLFILESEDSDVLWLWGFGMALDAASALLFVLIPLVGWWRRLDFAVPPALRSPTGAPEQWAEQKTLTHGNRQERRLRSRAKRTGRG
jgi:hypothetical protein